MPAMRAGRTSSSGNGQSAAPGLDGEFELLSQIVGDISSELALEPLLERTVERATRAIGADDGIIGLYSPTHRHFYTAAAYGRPMHSVNPYLYPGQGLAGCVLQTNATILSRYGDLPNPSDGEPADKMFLGVPIQKRGELIGVFCLGSRRSDCFNERAIELLKLFARHVAIAIGNARRYSEAQKRAERFALIASVSGLSTSDLGVETFLQLSADAIHETLAYTSVDIPLVDPHNPEAMVIRVRGGEHKRQVFRERRLPVSAGIMGAALRERRAQLVNDVARDPRYVVPPGVRPAKAELAIPLLHQDEALGVLNVEGEGPFDDLDFASLGIVAEKLALAIVKARLQAQTRRMAIFEERQRLSRDLHDNVTQIISSMSLIAQSMKEAWRRDPADGERLAARLAELSQLAFSELRGMLRELAREDRPSAPHAAKATRGLPESVQKLLRVMLPMDLPFEFSVVGYRPQAQAHEEAILRICQEAASNAVRHAAPHRIEVAIELTGTRLRATVADDGCGMPEHVERGMGLNNMRQRLQELGGSLSIAGRRPRGTRLVAELPRCDRTPESARSGEQRSS